MKRLNGLRNILWGILAGVGMSVAGNSCSGGNDGYLFIGNSQDYALIEDAEETPIQSGPVDTVVHGMKSNIVRGRLVDIFRDTNELQLTAATAVGMVPLNGLDGAYDTSHDIVKVKTCDDYLVDDLHYSMPYLVPCAAKLLHDIGRAFRDTIKARGGKEYRIKVTSMLRSTYSVSRLQRVNMTATSNSCHLYGSTFDISWSKFDCRDSSYVISLESLKNILAEIVYDKREQGLCYAIFEARSGCFHITARK